MRRSKPSARTRAVHSSAARIAATVCFAQVLIGALGACAGPPPKMFPVTPLDERRQSDQTVRREYDIDGDGHADFAELLATDGRIHALEERGRHRDDWTSLESNAAPRRHLLIVVDSVPYDLIRELRDAGRFRHFYPPARTIAPYPVMTDLSLSEFFGCSPCPGVEAEYFDGTRLHNGYNSYVQNVNVPWHQSMQYYMNTTAHAWAYPWPDAWFDHELRRIEETFTASRESAFNTYCVGTSALGARYGRDGHIRGLIRLDRVCQWLMQRERGRLDITLMSDHGHNLMSSHRIPLPEILERFGYHVGNHLKDESDVVVPEFGVVTCAAIHTRRPDRVARDAVNIMGIHFATYLDRAPDEVVIIARDGEARIARCADGRFRYTTQRGDPLQLMTVFAKLAGSSADDGVDDQALLEATRTHIYPDVVLRLWRAYHGLVKNPPDVLLDVEDGYHCGSPFFSKVIDLAAAHGNLGRLGTNGFCMTTTGELPQDLRMEDLRAALQKIGAPN